MSSAADVAGERLGRLGEVVARSDLHRRRGRVNDLIGLIVEASGLEAEIGEVCEVEAGRTRSNVPAEVVGFRAGRTLLMPLGDLHGLAPGHAVTPTGRPVSVPVGVELLGRVVDALGRPLDGAPLAARERRPVEAPPPDPLERPRITEQVSLGVRALDSLVPCGRGQRLGIFAGSGVGKSSLLGMIARSTSADVNVICLVGERGREVREFIERDLGEEGLSRSVVVVATSDQPALLRIKAALSATTIAEAFREQGADVMLMMDSVTRFAMAQREVGLAIGEPPATRGYTPSVFALLPRLLERSGTSPDGSITGLYTVLVDGDDFNEPIADAVRSILDGHVVLTRELAHAGHYPAIDVLQSVSRLVGEVQDASTRAAAQEVRGLLAAYQDKRDLIAIGAYERGTDPRTDRAIDARPVLEAFLRQGVEDPASAAEAAAQLRGLVGGALALELGELVADAAIPASPAVDHAAPVAVPSAIPPLHLPT
ncbi:MAG TPA: FliI/YscN family ATPase [Solirubrobacteraceae bacterium]